MSESKSITEIIQPIKLLAGSHADTGTTGHGCFMNVIAYLNGEAQITDQSPCVCVTVRRLAIVLNDRASDEQRQRLIPFIERAMGSATQDAAVLNARKARMRQYGAECQEIINAWRAARKAESAYAYANAYADADAYANADADAYANADAYADANADAKQKTQELKDALFDAGMRYLDDVLPKVETLPAEVVARSVELVKAFKQSAAA